MSTRRAALLLAFLAAAPAQVVPEARPGLVVLEVRSAHPGGVAASRELMKPLRRWLWFQPVVTTLTSGLVSMGAKSLCVLGARTHPSLPVPTTA